MSEKQYEDHLCQKCGSDIFMTVGNTIKCSACSDIRGYLVHQSESERVTNKECQPIISVSVK